MATGNGTFPGRVDFTDGTYGVGAHGWVCPPEFRRLFAGQKQQEQAAQEWVCGAFVRAWRRVRKPPQHRRTVAAMRLLAVKVAEKLGAKKTGVSALAGDPCELWESPNGGRLYLMADSYSFRPVPANWLC